MIELTIAPIVEGHGEVFAVPALLRRLAATFTPDVQLAVARPIRRNRSSLLQAGELEKDVELAADMIRPSDAILILIDTDGDCPAQLAAEIRQRASAARPDRRILVALAHCEYESWFVAAAASLASKRGLVASLVPPSRPESIRGAKEWLRNRMTGSRTYSETTDQVAFTHLFDIEAARTCRSFEHLCRIFTQFVAEAKDGSEC